MRVDQAIEDCHRWAREHADQGQELLDDLYRRQLEADIKFRGQPIATFLRPVFLSEAQRNLVRRASQVLLDCAERLIEQYMVDPEVRETIGLPQDEEEFARLDTGLARLSAEAAHTPPEEEIVVDQEPDRHIRETTDRFDEIETAIHAHPCIQGALRACGLRGPSAIGSEYPIPSSSISAPASKAALTTARDVL